MLAKELGVDRYELVSALYAIDAYLSKRLSISGSLRVDRDRFAFGRIAGIFPVLSRSRLQCRNGCSGTNPFAVGKRLRLESAVEPGDLSAGFTRWLACHHPKDGAFPV